MISAVLFHAPNKRFDEIVGSEKDQYTDVVGSKAVVTKTVTSSAGMVRYSGVNWRARLFVSLGSSSMENIEAGIEVKIESAEGNILYVVRRV